MKPIGLAALALCVAGCIPETPPPGSSEAFRAFVEDYFRAHFQHYPSVATGHGFHEYDAALEDYSVRAWQSYIVRLSALQARLTALRKEKLNSDETVDARLLEGQIQSELLDLRELQMWRRNPMLYVYVPGSSIDLLMKRDFAPAPERLRSVIARLRRVPQLVAAMKQNVVLPAREFTAVALRMAEGSVGFLRDAAPLWAHAAAGDDEKLRSDFEGANAAALAAMKDCAAWLKYDLLPRSTGTYAIGDSAFARKLLYEEMVDLPLDRLLAVGEANLEKDYRAFVATARQIDASRSPAAVMASLSANHPSEQTLILSARNLLESLRQFLLDKQIVTIPSDVRPTVAETPPYARSGGFASMDTPGAYERRASEAFYYITPPEKDWTPAHKREHLQLFSRPVMDIISVHEAWPGHYLQFLYARRFPTRTRKLIFSSTNVEGWAHYSEQMMLEQGLGNGDPRFRLAQLAEALVRDVRYVVGIRLHTEGMTVEQGARIFEQKAFQTKANAYEEARRGAYNPTYLYYTLGKLQVLKLREDYRRAKGSAFSLRQFHDDFIRQGGVPLKIMREILLPGDKGSVL